MLIVIIIVLLVVSSIFTFLWLRCKKQLDDTRNNLRQSSEDNNILQSRFQNASSNYHEEKNKWQVYCNELQDTCKQLRSQIALSQEELHFYRNNLNAQKKADDILQQAKQERDSIMNDARSFSAKMKSEIDTSLEKIAERNEYLAQFQPILNAQAVASSIMEQAKSESDILLNDARSKAASVYKLAEEKIQDANKMEESLSPYRPILDVLNVAASISLKIEDDKKKAEEAMRLEKLTTLNYTKELIADAQKQAYEVKKEAETRSKDMIDYATRIQDERLGPIAGELKRREALLKAVEHSLHGYGNDYLIPNYSLIDQLAKEYSFSQAGRDLEVSRDTVRSMVREGKASECDYAEKSRKDIASCFVLDAFNGKVDSILSKAKTDNFGKLRQQIEDAWVIVNHNGRAFRNARITFEYKEARIKELQRLVIVNELKKQEQEEQRHAREAAREEAKAIRERDKAIKQAEKEEEAIRKAVEEARTKFEQSSGIEKEKYEQKLAELESKLQDAEGMVKRTKSMAEQTKEGNVYIISNIGSFGENVYKIGLTRRLDPTERVKELGDASVPFGFDIHAMIHSTDAPALETALHQHFVRAQMNKVNPRKEFFKVSISVLKDEIEKLSNELQFDNISWTIKADAREYNETLKIEEQLYQDASSAESWEASQLRSIKNEYNINDEEHVE